MNLEEARNNIGAEVELNERTKPYTFNRDGIMHKNTQISGNLKMLDPDGYGNVGVINDDGEINWYSAKHLKLKSQDYKIHVPTKAESKEAQELFFELGINWYCGNNILDIRLNDYLFSMGNRLSHGLDVYLPREKEITLQDLREMVAKKRMKDFDEKQKLVFNPISVSDIADQVKDIALESIGVDLASDGNKCFDGVVGRNPFSQNFQPHKEMTWEDALRAVADGKEVEMLDSHNQWENLKDFYIYSVIEKGNKFRLAPQRITLNGNFTKEELLQKIGEIK